MVRTGAGMFFASALFALLPTLAQGVSNSAIGYGLLLGCFGAGAVFGALVMQPLRARCSTETVVSVGVTILGVAIMTTAALRSLSTLGPVILIGGGAWILFISLVNALIQNLTPDWVRARVLAVFILVSQGSMAFGSTAWGAVAQRAGIRTALMWAGLGAIGTTVLALVAKLPDATSDLSPWNHWRMPVVVREVRPELERGPVLVTVEYVVVRERQADFVQAMHQYERIRRRDGASRGRYFMTWKPAIAIWRYFW
jgi:MFS family permease